MNQPFALIIPCYNFESGISNTLERLDAWRHTLPQVCHLFLVDDGSTDGTGRLLRAYAASRSTDCTLIQHSANKGKGAAILSGLRAATKCYEYLVFTDCDLHYGVDIISQRLLPELVKCDLVILDRAWANQCWESRLRKLASNIYNRLVSILTGVNFRDTQSGLKGLRASRCAPIVALQRIMGFAFDVELLSLVCYYRLHIRQIPIVFGQDYEAPTHSTVRLISAAFRMTFDLFRINWHWKRGHYRSASLEDQINRQTYRILSTPPKSLTAAPPESPEPKPLAHASHS